MAVIKYETGGKIVLVNAVHSQAATRDVTATTQRTQALLVEVSDQTLY